MKKGILFAMLSLMLLIGGCLTSETPVLTLNAGSAPDLSGTYVRTKTTQSPGIVQTEEYIIIFKKSEKGNNAYDITSYNIRKSSVQQKGGKPIESSVKDKPANYFALVEALDDENILFQAEENGEYLLFPAKLQKDGFILYPQPTDGTPKTIWKESVWKPAFEKYNLSYKLEKNYLEILQKDMTQEQYRELVKFVLKDISAADGFGKKGVLYKKAPSVKIGTYSNDSVSHEGFRWKITLNADKTFSLYTEDFEGPQTLPGTWDSDASGNITAKFAKGKTSFKLTGGGTDVLTMPVWPYGNMFDNTPFYYGGSKAAAKPAAPAPTTPAAPAPANPAPAAPETAAPAPTTPATSVPATPEAAAPAAPASNSTNATAVPVSVTPATPVTTPAKPAPAVPVPATPEATPPVSLPPLTPDQNGKPKIAGTILRFEKGVVDVALQVLAPGKTMEAVRIDNVGGVASAWRSDGKDAAAPLNVMDGTASLAGGQAAMAFAPGAAEKLLTLSFSDNGAVAGGETELRITVFFTDKSRAMCLVGNSKAFAGGR